jgi:murein L,D-transpeptidase YafK
MKRFTMTAVVTLVVGSGLLAAAHWPESPLPDGTKADRVVVRKGARRLALYSGEELIREYSISLGGEPLGHKQREGDGRTPEGRYLLDYRNANSSFHRSLHISYPSPTDTAAARSRGESPGGLIMVHGMKKNGLRFLGRAHTLVDWTDGCIAVTNREIEEIWRVVPDGTPIILEP